MNRRRILLLVSDRTIDEPGNALVTAGVCSSGQTRCRFAPRHFSTGRSLLRPPAVRSAQAKPAGKLARAGITEKASASLPALLQGTAPQGLTDYFLGKVELTPSVRFFTMENLDRLWFRIHG